MPIATSEAMSADRDSKVKRSVKGSDKSAKKDEKVKKEKKDKKDKKEKKEKKEKKSEKKVEVEKKVETEKKVEVQPKENIVVATAKGMVGDPKKRKSAEDIAPPAKKLKEEEVKKEEPASPTNQDALLPVREWRQKHSMEVPPTCPEPIRTFDAPAAAKWPKCVHDGLKNLKYTVPTPIQAQTWPIALQPSDMVGIAETGSGKTMAFLLPALVRLQERKDQINTKKPSILVLAPTRELAQQINQVAVTFLARAGLFSVCVYGGDGKGQQINLLKRGCSVVVATPGRLTDLYNMGFLDLSQVFYVVLDEADRMLDMGFEPQIRQIFQFIPQERQTMMFTATFPKEIRDLAYSFQTHPVMLKLGNQGDMTTNKNITQKIYIVEPFEKYNKLKELISQHFVDNCRMLVFSNTKAGCDGMAQRLWDDGLPVNAIHGDLDQYQRNRAMDQFKNGTLPILFATDVAARGLDVKGVKHVVNVDFPCGGFPDYVHRIGRTGRAGETGFAHTLVTKEDVSNLRDLLDHLEQCEQEVPVELRDMVRARFGGGSGHGGRGGRFGGRGGRNGRFGGGRRGGGGGRMGPNGTASRFDRGGRRGGGSRGGGRGGGNRGSGGSGFGGSEIFL